MDQKKRGEADVGESSTYRGMLADDHCSMFSVGEENFQLSTTNALDFEWGLKKR